MLTAGLAALGAALIAVAVADAVVTTLAASGGGGPLTRRVATGLWRLLRATSRGGPTPVLAYAGVLVLLSVVLTWVVLVWAGWALVFSSSEGAVVGATDGEPASLPARIYYAGFVVFTLGVGDFVAGSGVWQVLTALASFLGLFLVTLAITYLVSVVAAAVDRRALARDVHLSGETGEDILRRHWDGQEFSSSLDTLAQSWTDRVVRITQQHLAYPVLHRFHAPARASSAARALAALDDAVLPLRGGVAPHSRPADDTLLRLQRALDHYASTVGGARTAGPPPAPDLRVLADAGIPTVPVSAYDAAAADHDERRRKLAHLVAHDAWAWPGSPTGDRPDG